MYHIIAAIGIVFVTSVAQAATLEIPGLGTTQSGIGVISGWKCGTTGLLTVRFDGGDSFPLVYGSERTDTRGVCGDTNNGFVAIWNWGNLDDGEYTAVVYDDGVEFDRATFTVVTTGVEFLRGVTGLGMATLSNGQKVTLVWAEASQGFVATEFTDLPDSGSGLCSTKTAKVDRIHESSQWTVTNLCDGETLDIDMTPLTSDGFSASYLLLEFVQGGVQFDRSHFDWFDRNTLDRVGNKILPGITKQTTVDVGGKATSLNFSQPFKMYYDEQFIFEFP